MITSIYSIQYGASLLSVAVLMKSLAIRFINLEEVTWYISQSLGRTIWMMSDCLETDQRPLLDTPPTFCIGQNWHSAPQLTTVEVNFF